MECILFDRDCLEVVVVLDLFWRRVVFWLLGIFELNIEVLDDVEMKFDRGEVVVNVLGFVKEFCCLVIVINGLFFVIEVFMVEIFELLCVFVKSDFDCENGLGNGSEIFWVVMLDVIVCVKLFVDLVNWFLEYVGISICLFSGWIVLG